MLRNYSKSRALLPLKPRGLIRNGKSRPRLDRRSSRRHMVVNCKSTSFRDIHSGGDESAVSFSLKVPTRIRKKVRVEDTQLPSVKDKPPCCSEFSPLQQRKDVCPEAPRSPRRSILGRNPSFDSEKSPTSVLMIDSLSFAAPSSVDKAPKPKLSESARSSLIEQLSKRNSIDHRICFSPPPPPPVRLRPIRRKEGIRPTPGSSKKRLTKEEKLEKKRRKEERKRAREKKEKKRIKKEEKKKLKKEAKEQEKLRRELETSDLPTSIPRPGPMPASIVDRPVENSSSMAKYIEYSRDDDKRSLIKAPVFTTKRKDKKSFCEKLDNDATSCSANVRQLPAHDNGLHPRSTHKKKTKTSKSSLAGVSTLDPSENCCTAMKPKRKVYAKSLQPKLAIEEDSEDAHIGNPKRISVRERIQQLGFN